MQHVTDTQKAIAETPLIPQYLDYEEHIKETFKTFSKGIIAKYATHFGVDSKLLELILRNFSGDSLTNFFSMPLFQKYLDLMHNIKSKKKPSAPFIDNEQFNSLILPPFIPSISNVSGWLGLARFTNDVEERIKLGWWINVGERIILLRNLPQVRQHFYVSDHGECVHVIKQIKQNSIEPNSDEGRQKMSHCFKFWKHYQHNLNDDERKYLKEHFIIMLNEGLGGNSARNEFLLFVLSLPKSYRARTLQNDRLNFPGFNMSTTIGLLADDSSWIEPPNKEKLDKIPLEEQTENAEIFTQALERIRYLGNIQTKTFISQLFQGQLSPYFTQIDQIFNTHDSQQYKIFFVLNHLALQLGKGLQEYLLRPIKSFGSAEEGESYRGFSRAFDCYFRSSSPSIKNSTEIAKIMRSLLRGKKLVDESLYFLPNLVSAWFVSEAARNDVSVLSSLMLLDLIESGVKLIDDDGNDLYSWRHVLIHPKKPAHTMDKVPIKDMYGDTVDLANFDGIHPMAHAGSVPDSRVKLGENQKLSAVRQKEGHLAIHWLSERLKNYQPQLKHYLVVAKPESESIKEQPCCLLQKKKTSYKLINKLLAATKKSASIKKNTYESKKWDLLHKTIIPLLNIRLLTLGHLLSKSVFNPQQIITHLDITAAILGSLQIEVAPHLII